MPPITIITLLEEFIHRGDALKISLSGRDDTSLEAILHFIMRHITNSRYTEILMATLDEIINLYSDVIHSSPMIHQLFQKIRRKIRIELNFQKELEMIMGSMDMLMGFSESIKGIKISE